MCVYLWFITTQRKSDRICQKILVTSNDDTYRSTIILLEKILEKIIDFPLNPLYYDYKIII